tara:strand:+ start:210 stop:329 length:120 start_codon:yes stop_codon:yes gene_type:complete
LLRECFWLIVVLEGIDDENENRARNVLCCQLALLGGGKN